MPIASLIHVATGPTIINVTGTAIKSVNAGTRNILTTAGQIFFIRRSTLDAKNTARTAGITVDA